jgi:hypothetical protein
MKYSFVQWGIWLAGAGLEIAILYRLVSSRLFREFPFATAYFAWKVIWLAPAMLAWAYLSRKSYGDAYWLNQAVSWALVFLVILELYDRSFKDYEGMRRVCRTFVSWAGLLFMLLVCGTILVGSVVEDDPRQWINMWLFLMQRSIRLVHAALLFFLAAFVGWFQIRTSSLLRYLTLVWLADGATGVASAALRYHFGLAAYPVLTVAGPICSIVILGGWYWALSRSYAPAETRAWPARELTSAQADLLMRRLGVIEATLGRAYH